MHAADELSRGLRVERTQLVDIGAAAERLAVAAQDDDADGFIDLLQSRVQRRQQRGIESVDLLRAVEEDARDPTIALKLHHAFIL